MSTILVSDESGGSFDNLPAGLYEGQEFQLSQNASVTSISLKISKGSTNSGQNIKISIRDGSPNGTVLVSKEFPASVLQSYNGSSVSWTEFVFDSPVNLSSGTTYCLRFEPASGGSGGDEYRRSFDSTLAYTGGRAFYGNQPSGTPNFLSWGDLNFRVSGDVVASFNVKPTMFNVF